ncbi:MAG TPA: heavy metal translocating P-type ATPase metal-binding domain-containing protein [Saprospiraceae bacterium]|nr:heavy metal translocating P-type ATPase metal-binding domain-containing protein [Saprospiraceae bacterium]HPI06127.1 heavy metal translocating P-type ATPase metal-binding domain-containing protein [Saprospiraceae bacterium]
MASTTLLQPKNPAVLPHSCFHCHDVCPDDHLHIEDKYFCCDGCKMVFEILNTHNLCEYYALDVQPGQSLKNQRHAKAFAYLDDPEVQEKLLEFNNGQTAQVTFYLPQMHCVSCIWLLENLYKLDAGVTYSRVTFLKKTATIQYNPEQTSLRKMAALLSSIGYAPEINLGDIDNAKPKFISKRLAYQIGIAGFAFGNIMLFSFPDYVGMDAETYRWFADIFGYLSVILAVPVLLVSARDYLVSAWNGLRQGHLNIEIPLCLALLSLFGRSIWEIFTHTGPGYLDSFAGLTFLLLIGKWFQQRTWSELSFERDYKSYFPVAASLKNGEEETSVPVNRLVPGDIIVVRSQEIIPADGILLKGSAQVDYSFVTGEAEPQTIKSGERIFAGGKQVGESIEVSLTRRVSQSYLTRLWNDQAFKENEQGQVTKLADQAGRIFSWMILVFGVGAFLYWMPTDMGRAINAFTAVMIVACPCTVALSIPFTLGNIMRILGRHRFYLKNIKTVESFSAIDSVIFDKTGTITNVAQQSYQFKGKPLNAADKVAIRSLTKHSSHPLSRRLYESMPEVPVVAPENFREIPGLGIQGKVQGRELKIGSAAFVGAEGQGLFISIDGENKGCYEVKSRYRVGLMQILAYFRQTKAASWFGKKQSDFNHVWLLSGDQDREATALAPFFPERETMLFERSPQDKLEFVKKLQRHGRQVMMLGDGLNDAGALRQSNLGVVVAEDTNNFTPACDAILHADEFENLPKFVELARAGVSTVKKSYAVAIIYNIIGLGYSVTGHLSPLVAAVLMPTSSISIVVFGVLMSNWAARRILK